VGLEVILFYPWSKCTVKPMAIQKFSVKIGKWGISTFQC